MSTLHPSHSVEREDKMYMSIVSVEILAFPSDYDGEEDDDKEKDEKDDDGFNDQR